MSIVVTGATGHLGRLVVEQLLARGVAADGIVATGRSVERIKDLADRGVRVARADFGDQASLDAVLSAGDVLLLTSGNEPGARLQQHRNVVDAAVGAGVARIAYTSILGGDGSTLVLAPDHVETEHMVRDSGLTWTLLRNGWYTENYAAALEQAQATGAISASVGDGRVASATRADFAAAIATVLSTDGHDNAVYELSGDYAWSFDELAQAAADVLGREVTYQRLTPEEHLGVLRGAGLDEGTAEFVVALDGGIRDGQLAGTSGDLSRLAGRPTTPLVEALRELARS